MTRNAVTDQPPQTAPDGFRGGPAVPENAPSLIRPDDPVGARIVGFVALLFFVFGIVAIGFNRYGMKTWIDVGVGAFFAVLGSVGLLFHANRERDKEMRRLYGGFSAILLAAALFFTLAPFADGFGTQFAPSGFPLFVLGGLFLLAFIRSETELHWQRGALLLLGFLGLVQMGTGLIGGSISGAFLTPAGLLLSLLGLGYLWAFTSRLPEGDPAQTRAGWLLCGVGLLVLAVVIVRALLLPLLFQWNLLAVRPDASYFASSGVLLAGLGLVYAAVGVSLTFDFPVVVMARRELASFFYSPTVYFVLVATTIIAGLQYFFFVLGLVGGAPEPIVAGYILTFIPAFTMILIVPLLTMRSLSEDRSSGTMEVLFTAPVNEWPVVLGKFFAALVVFLVTWLPYGLFLIALRLELNQPFDYRPLVSFSIGLLCSGCAFLAMGVFFSSLTRSQIIAAILTTMGMLFMFGTFIVKQFDSVYITPGTKVVLTYFSFIDLWQETLLGQLVVGQLLVYLSLAAFWLFLTTRVLESRKWS